MSHTLYYGMPNRMGVGRCWASGVRHQGPSVSTRGPPGVSRHDKVSALTVPLGLFTKTSFWKFIMDFFEQRVPCRIAPTEGVEEDFLFRQMNLSAHQTMGPVGIDFIGVTKHL